MEVKDLQVKDLTVIKVVEKAMEGLVAIASLVAVCWLGYHGMKGLLWYPIIVGFIAVLAL